MEDLSLDYTTPAMQALVVAVENICKVEVVRKHRHFALFYLKFLHYLVNPTATLTEDQAGAIAAWLIDYRLPNESDFPKLPELLPLATYINSCKI